MVMAGVRILEFGLGGTEVGEKGVRLRGIVVDGGRSDGGSEPWW